MGHELLVWWIGIDGLAFVPSSRAFLCPQQCGWWSLCNFHDQNGNRNHDNNHRPQKHHHHHHQPHRHPHHGHTTDFSDHCLLFNLDGVWEHSQEMLDDLPSAQRAVLEPPYAGHYVVFCTNISYRFPYTIMQTLYLEPERISIPWGFSFFWCSNDVLVSNLQFVAQNVVARFFRCLFKAHLSKKTNINGRC